MLCCRDVMKSDVKCLDPQETVMDAAVRMREEGIGFLPVCDDTGQVLGTITDRDVTVRVVAVGESTAWPVGNYMTPRAVACRPSDDLATAEEIMSQEQVSRILCVNERGELEGVISLSDIAQVEEEGRAARTLRDVSEREVRI